MSRTRTGLSGAGVAVVAAILALALLGLGLRWVLAEPTGAVEQREQTIGSGDYRIQAYEQFFTECASARTLQQNLTVARTAAGTNYPDENRQAQLDANVIALESQLNQAVNTYNAHAMQADTRAHFLDSNLPFQLTTTEEIRCDVP